MDSNKYFFAHENAVKISLKIEYFPVHVAHDSVSIEKCGTNENIFLSYDCENF